MFSVGTKRNALKKFHLIKNDRIAEFNSNILILIVMKGRMDHEICEEYDKVRGEYFFNLPRVLIYLMLKTLYNNRNL